MFFAVEARARKSLAKLEQQRIFRLVLSGASWAQSSPLQIDGTENGGRLIGHIDAAIYSFGKCYYYAFKIDDLLYVT